jgi:AFG3 family protein
VAAMLLEKETITHDDVIDLIGPRPFKSDAQYDEFVSRRRTEEPKAEKTATDAAAQDEEGTAPVNPGLA